MKRKQRIQLLLFLFWLSWLITDRITKNYGIFGMGGDYIFLAISGSIFVFLNDE